MQGTIQFLSPVRCRRNTALLLLIWHLCLHPFAAQPPVQHVQTGDWLVIGDHVTTSVQTDESEVTRALDGTDLGAVVEQLQVLHWRLLVGFVARPLELAGPGEVAEPVEEEVTVDVEVAAVVAVDLGTECLHHLWLVEVLLDPVQLVIAEAVAATLLADIVWVHAGALVRADDGVVAVDGSRHAGPDRLAVVAALDERLAAWESVVHACALLLREDRRPASITACHRTVVLVLSEAISQTVTNQDRPQVDVALLVGEYLRREDGDVVTRVGLAGDVEWLLCVLWELLEEQSEQGVDVLAGSNSVGDRGAGVGIADVHGLVKEDDRGVSVPAAWVVVEADVLGDAAGAKLHEETGQGRTAWAAVQPQNVG